jgi:hypothetical protein
MSPKPMRDFALEVYFSKWEFVAKYNMTGSDAENMSLGELLALASDEDRQAFSTPQSGLHGDMGRSGAARGDRPDLRQRQCARCAVFCGCRRGHIYRDESATRRRRPRDRRHSELSGGGEHTDERLRGDRRPARPRERMGARSGKAESRDSTQYQSGVDQFPQ